MSTALRGGRTPTVRPPQVPERELLSMIVRLAGYRRWLVHHCRPAQTADGRWRTPIQGSAGFPDLLLVRDDRMLVREVKTRVGKLSPLQQKWLDTLRAAGVDADVWRPGDWQSGRIQRELG